MRINRPYPRYCPRCGITGEHAIKENTDLLYRCRKCQCEFYLDIRYNPEDDTNWFNGKRGTKMIAVYQQGKYENKEALNERRKT